MTPNMFGLLLVLHQCERHRQWITDTPFYTRENLGFLRSWGLLCYAMIRDDGTAVRCPEGDYIILTEAGRKLVAETMVFLSGKI